MATYLGKDGTITADASGVGEITNFAVNITADTAEDTAFGDGWKTRKAGLKDWSATIDCHFDQANAGQAVLIEGATVACVFTCHTNATFTGSGIVTSRGISNSDPNGTSLVAHNVQVTGAGTLTEG